MALSMSLRGRISEMRDGLIRGAFENVSGMRASNGVVGSGTRVGWERVGRGPIPQGDRKGGGGWRFAGE